MTWNVPGYRVERRLGGGATGEVWAGRDEATGEPVALKRLRPGGAEPDREQLRSEAALLAAFQHPNVVRLRGVLGSSDGLVLVLDLAPGGSLAQLLTQRGRLRSGQVVGLVTPVAKALGAAHAAGLVHGDVSPGNVLLNADGRPLLADLGTARLAGDGAAQAHGTSGYVDPAVLAGAAPTAASDVYSLAAVAAHALTGQPVGEAPDALERWADHAQLLGVPLALVLAICKALDPDPARRPDVASFSARIRDTSPSESVLDVRPDADPADVPAACGGLAGGGGLIGAELVDAELAGGRAAGAGVPAGGGAADGDWPGDGLFLADDGVLTVPGAVTRRVPRRPRPLVTVPARSWRSRFGRSALTRRRLPGVPPPASRPARAAARWVAVIAAVAVLTTVAGVAWFADGSPSNGASATTSVDGEWRLILGTLDAHRESAFATAEPRLLDEVYVPDALPLAADQQSIQVLREAKATASGVRHDIRRVRVVTMGDTHVRVEMTDRMPAYRIVNAAGATLRTVPARAERVVLVDLERTATGWQIRDLSEPP